MPICAAGTIGTGTEASSKVGTWFCPLCFGGHDDVGKYQQYLAKNPFGYRCHDNTAVRFPSDS